MNDCCQPMQYPSDALTAMATRGQRLRHCIFTAVAMFGPLAGCSTLTSWNKADRDYDATKRAIGGQYGDGIFRPEGKTAEEGSSVKLLNRFGLTSKSRKDIEAARKAYDEGNQAFAAAKELTGRQRRDAFLAAATHYKKAAQNWQSSQLEQDALLMQAECQFFAEDYYRAEHTYAKLVKEYPRNPYLDQIDARRFEIADYWLKYNAADPKPFVVVNFTDNKRPWNDTAGHGKRVLENLRLDNPIGKVSDDATMRLATNYFEKEDYESAAATFGELRMTYPDSPHQFKAQYLELQSLLLSYMGPEYSDSPLIEADKRAKAIVRLFPQEANERQLELREAMVKINYLMAERQWRSAEYRFLQGENRSARMYLQQLLDDYPDTPFAEQAREKLAELNGKPDRPPQRFTPLIKLLRADADDRTWSKPDVEATQ
ncbi:MAG: outer membrane protein assembly factor BamD [Pirellulaceae bacterium]|nr:outer membrane protein assembly factor BamD [Pirellulaceae bacterium]